MNVNLYVGLAVMIAGVLSSTGAVFAYDGRDHEDEEAAAVRVEARASVQSDSGAEGDPHDAPEQDHDPSGSDRADGVDAVDPDDDGDGVPTTHEQSGIDADGDGYGDMVEIRGEGRVEANGKELETMESMEGAADVALTKSVDKSSPKVLQALSIDASSPALYEGVLVRVAADVCGVDDEDCDDGDVEVRPGRVAYSVNVSGAVVRGWDAEKKEEVQARLAAITEINTANDFGIWVAGQALENSAISEISSDNTQTEVRYTTRLRLFGFIPMNTKATARADADGRVSVKYPWYGFLARKGDQSRFTQLAADIRSKHEATLTLESELEGEIVPAGN